MCTHTWVLEVDSFLCAAALLFGNIGIVIASVLAFLSVSLLFVLSIPSCQSVAKEYVPKRMRKPPKISLIDKVNELVTWFADWSWRRLRENTKKNYRRPMSMFRYGIVRSVKKDARVISSKLRRLYRRFKRTEWYKRKFYSFAQTFPEYCYPESYDSDSGPLIVDNGCSASISPHREDFVGKLTPVRTRVGGFGGGSVGATHRGTIRWAIQDDFGMIYQIFVKNSYLCPGAPSRMLSPQHWAKGKGDHYPIKEGTGCTTNSKEVILYWDQKTVYKTITLDKATNIAITATAPCYEKYKAYVATIEDLYKEVETPFVLPAAIIEDDDDATQVVGQEEALMDDDNLSFSEPTSPARRKTVAMEPENSLQSEIFGAKNDNQPLQVTFSDLPKPHIIPEEEEPMQLTPHDELLRWHYRLGHLPFRRLIKMCLQGILPKNLMSVKPPFCPACQYGGLTKRAWRTRGKGNQPSGKITITIAGQCVSVDQLESSTVGFIAQTKGKLTTMRYKFATIFVDHFSNLSFVYLQKRLTSLETVQAKVAFEHYCRLHGVKVLHYHADNGRFADLGFVEHCKKNGQGLTYCGVNAHFQNGRAEKKIRDLQQRTRTMLLFAMNKWPDMLSTSLWPYGLRMSSDAENSTPQIREDQSPLEMFTRVKVRPKLKHFHTFGCPTYILDNNLAAGKSIPKWKFRSRLGVYLGPSPNHAKTVSLVLNPRTGHVSPQFHLKHDDFFETISGKSTDFDSPPPDWKVLSKLVVVANASERGPTSTKKTEAIVGPSFTRTAATAATGQDSSQDPLEAVPPLDEVANPQGHGNAVPLCQKNMS
jgi:hypothetical protein